MAVLLFLHFLRTEVLLLHGVCLPVGNCSFSLPFVNNFMKNKGLSGLDPPWLTTVIKKHIRKRKRAYLKAKQTNLQTHWVKFKHLRNLVTSMIRESKKAFHDNIANKLKSDSLSSKQWWTILKSFISPYSKSSIPPLEVDGVVYSDEMEKANVLNDFLETKHY